MRCVLCVFKLHSYQNTAKDRKTYFWAKNNKYDINDHHTNMAYSLGSILCSLKILAFYLQQFRRESKKKFSKIQTIMALNFHHFRFPPLPPLAMLDSGKKSVRET